jgi:beta-lactam-binding protein with PASTA domain
MKKLFYFLPFLFFIVGYYSLSWLTHVKAVQVPALVGLPLSKAVLELSEKQLNVRMLAFHEEPDLAPGTVINQIPAAGSSIKPHQRVFVVVAKEPETFKAPCLVGVPFEQAQQAAKKHDVRIKQYVFTSSQYPKNMVVAQWPHEGQPLKDKTVVVYVCSGDEPMIVFPDFYGIPVPQLQQFCSAQGIALEIKYATASDEKYAHEQCVVKNQRPLAGSLLDVSKGLKVNVNIAHQ